jgi:hypothetical protein
VAQNDRPDLAGGEIHGEGRRAFYLGRGKAVRRIALAVQAILGAQSSIVSSRRFILRSAIAQLLCSEPENCALPSKMPAVRPPCITPMPVSAFRSRSCGPTIRPAEATAPAGEGLGCGHRRRPRRRFAFSDQRMRSEGRTRRKWIAAEMLPTIGGLAATQCSRTFCRPSRRMPRC